MRVKAVHLDFRIAADAVVNAVVCVHFWIEGHVHVNTSIGLKTDSSMLAGVRLPVSSISFRRTSVMPCRHRLMLVMMNVDPAAKSASSSP